jgi:hypothetical protein
MTRNENVALREALPLGASEQQQPSHPEQDVSNDQSDLRQRESNTKRACVLLGSAISQLPIWGRLNSALRLQSY